ncbi:MAG: glycosyltransferase [Acidimicrobiia bacterium]
MDSKELGPFLARSRAAAAAVAAITAEETVDLIEFQDFDGLAYTALVDRSQLGLDRTRIGVRMHGPADLMFESIGVMPDEIVPVLVMEAEAFRMADTVVVPSESMRKVVLDRYQLEPVRVVVGEPPVPELEPVPLVPNSVPEIVFFGRLAEVKGAHDFVAAAKGVLSRHPDALIRLIGPDGWSAEARKPMQEWLKSLIPEHLADRFRFEGAIDRSHLGEALASAWMVVLPSRFESFSLAVHEVRGLRLPVVLPDLPAFRGFLGEETGALMFEPSVAGLEAAIERLIGEEPLRKKLTEAPPPRRGDPLAVYRSGLPAPRHPRSQAGLATAAVKRFEETAFSATPQAGVARLVRRAFRALPAPLARGAVRMVPQSIKDRVRPVANWREEAARRAREERISSVRNRIDRGDFPEIDEPLVTIVIPCFDQGRFLEDALLSVFEQSFPFFEVVVVDDGSRDPETIAILDELDWPRTQLLRQENRGLPAARNAGMKMARAPFLVPLDADDELAPDYLMELVNALDRNPMAAYAHCWTELFGEQRALFVTRPFNPYQLLLSNPIIGCVLMRRRAWEEVGGYDESMKDGHEDWELWIRMLRAGWTETAVRLPLFRYRKHGISMSVDTEARFEQGRAAIVQRHSDLYQFSEVRELKRRWYPWVSIILTSEQVAAVSRWDIDDAELVAIDDNTLAAALASQKGWGCQGPVGSLAQAVAAARGKFLIVADALGRPSPEAVVKLATALEQHPEALGAAPNGSQRPVLWRHWAVVDRGAPHRSVIEVDVTIPVVEADGLGPGTFPQRDWEIHAELESAGLSLPVQRQPPEEEGRLPSWVNQT